MEQQKENGASSLDPSLLFIPGFHDFLQDRNLLPCLHVAGALEP